MSVAVMKALHSLIPLISDAYSASLPPNYHPHPIPPPVAINGVRLTFIHNLNYNCPMGICIMNISPVDITCFLK